jgi:PST family polysaccharide transporter
MSDTTPTRGAVARAVSWMGVGYGVSQGLFLGSLLLLAALLPPRDFGSVATGMVLVNLAGLLVDAGTRGSIVAAPTLTRSDIRGALTLNLVVGAAATAAIAALAGPIVSAFAQGGDADVISALSLGVLLYAAGITPLALLQKRLEFKRFATANVVSAGVSAMAGIGAVLLGAGVWSLVIRQLVSMGLLSLCAWWLARDLLPEETATAERPVAESQAPAGQTPGPVAARGPAARRWVSLRQPGWTGFVALALTDFVALNADFLVVGNLTEATGLGLYSLAFTLAFAPLTQVSWQVGRVLFPAAAATTDPETVGRRTLVSLRMLALLLLPVAVPVIVLAPTVLPGLFGPEWRPMVAPFQILLVVGVGHALVGMIGESLSGTGHIGWRARVNLVWAVAMVGALVVLVSEDGIRGAAWAHALLFVPFGVAYATFGARRLGVSAGRVAAAVAPVLGPVAVQALVTFGLALGFETAGIEGGWAGLGSAVAGLVVVALLLRRGPLREAGAVLADARAGGP